VSAFPIKGNALINGYFGQFYWFDALWQLKDLKKQIQSERSRADRLQEKLQQFLSESQSVYTHPRSLYVTYTLHYCHVMWKGLDEHCLCWCLIWVRSMHSEWRLIMYFGKTMQLAITAVCSWCHRNTVFILVFVSFYLWIVSMCAVIVYNGYGVRLASEITASHFTSLRASYPHTHMCLCHQAVWIWYWWKLTATHQPSIHGLATLLALWLRQIRWLGFTVIIYSYKYFYFIIDMCMYVLLHSCGGSVGTSWKQTETTYWRRRQACPVLLCFSHIY